MAEAMVKATTTPMPRVMTQAMGMVMDRTMADLMVEVIAEGKCDDDGPYVGRFAGRGDSRWARMMTTAMAEAMRIVRAMTMVKVTTMTRG